MDFIKGLTFGAFACRGSLDKEETRLSLRNAKERTGIDTILLVPNALQDTAQSEKIDFTSKATVSDQELTEFIRYARELGLRVILKPTVNCKTGTWRAHINFFDQDVPCEPKWSNWFRSYTDYQLHFAEIAEQEKCEMFIAGCEMVMSERREQEWRRLITDIRSVYHGLVSYNTDKYQEDHVSWWDAVDVISSSGYYPLTDWEQELDRIEKVVRSFDKPFFFAEAGCMSTEGSSKIPNNWMLRGKINLQEQAEWYQTMFDACDRRDWVGGYCAWDWSCRQYALSAAASDARYDIYGKPAEKVVHDYYEKH
ncbi:MAG: 1,4-beta-xylanase [bacterium]|nr:1,4-beta-xylanase [bacterium]